MIRADVVEKLHSSRVQAFSVFIPMVPGDSSGPAEGSASKLKEAGIASFWDGKRDLGRQFVNVVTLPGKRKVAWDIYFLFGPDAVWDDQPPKPVFWMHQLANDERCLDGAKFRDRVQTEIDKLPKRLVFLTREGCANSPEMKRGSTSHSGTSTGRMATKSSMSRHCLPKM